jgi:hypothetical protein
MLQKTGIWALRVIRILGIVVAVAVFLGLGMYALRVHNSHITRMSIHVNNPVSAHFADDNPTVLLNDAPDVNNNREIVPANPLRISYEYVSGPGAPAFNTNISQSELTQNVKITPAIRGRWSMPTPYEIEFRPDGDWPAETKFNVKIGDKLFNNDVRPNRHSISFRTAPITATTELFNIYPTSENNRTVVGVAAISFNYPIQTRDFANKVSIKQNGHHVDFDVKLDRYMRTAVIRTAPIKIDDKNHTLRLKVNRITDATGKSHTDKITAKTNIESADNFFKIADLETITADDKMGNPQQLILLNMTSAAANNTNWEKFITAYLLPRNAPNDDDTDEPHIWANDEITSDVLKKSELLDIKRVNFINPTGTYQYAFSYRVSDNVPRFIYVTVKPDIKSANGFVTKNGVSRVLDVAYPTRSVKIAGTGALLSLAGDKKLAIVARGGVDMAYVNLYKIESDAINHLITQTYNLFSDLEFRAPWIFDAYDMSVVFQKKIPFSDTSLDRVNYAALNLGEYLDRTYNDKTGIFIVKTGASEDAAEYSDARLILLTNLGIIRKINLDQSSVVFVSYISDGRPAGDIDVTVLGRNGYPIWAGVTNSDGRVDIPNFDWNEYRNEKEPVAVIARTSDDVSFIPYNADRTQGAEYSKFDVGGAYATNMTALQSFVFSDRGIYRPGESVTIGAIIENKNFTTVAGIPVKFEISDSRGRTIFDKKVSLAADGMLDNTYKLPTDAPLGQYDVNIYSLNNRGHVHETIGSGNFMVQEFVPDTIKMLAVINGANQDGWISPDNITANVSLNNLYGTPATNRRVNAHATLRPVDFVFDEYKQYKFTPNFTSGTTASNGFVRTSQTFTTQTYETRTDENGNATIEIKFDREIPIGTYMLNLIINGFEAGDGKSIQTIINSRISNMPYIIGYKPEPDLTYIKRNSEKSVNFIALDATGTAIDANNLTMKLVRRENLTSLVKDYTNHYKYQTVSHDITVSQSQISVPSNGTAIKLNTSSGGTYYMQLFDSNGNMLANLEYFVASDENTEMRGDSRAELQIKLDASEYKPGDTINISITAPYTGTGLITVERDKVYAHAWFTAKTTTSTQKITLPDDFEGTGYVNVSFVRDINSRDIFTTPYTYAVAPFSTRLDKRKIGVDLSVPKTVTDNKLPVEIITNRDARVMIFAVNTGILNVAKYKIPNPIKHFFQKAALQVETYQILSLLLPEYNILREVAKTGGSDYSNEFDGLDIPLTNPFGRKTLPPVAFYSGILETKAGEKQEIKFDIPEYFNGAISVYAVAAGTGTMGAADSETRIQSPVILSVSAPTFVAPNDKFVVNTIISNLTNDIAKNPTARTDATISGKLQQIEKPVGTLEIPENTEKLWTFDVVADSVPGTADINVSATLFDDNNHAIASRKTSHFMTIRPATPFQTDIQIGTLSGTRTTIKHIQKDMYDENLTQTLYISNSPSVLARPMFMYLSQYDYSCTEQLVSRALPYLVMPDNKLVGTKNASENINRTIQTLGNRQNDDGSFALWATGNKSMDNASDSEIAYLTGWVVEFLTVARQNGFNVPQNMLARGIDFLRSYAGQVTTSYSDAVAKAMAIYTLSLNDYVTTSYIESLEEYLDENVKNWSESIIGPYIAASYKMLKQTDKAFNLISKYKTNTSMKPGIFTGSIANDARYEFIARKYFDMHFKNLTKSITNYINAGKYDSFTAAAIIMDITGNNTQSDKIDFANITVSANGEKLTSDSISDGIMFAIPNGTEKLQINCTQCNRTDNLYYTIITQGFPRTIRSESNGIEITRRYYDINGHEIFNASIGDIVDVKIVARTRGGTEKIANAVILDLLPAGFVPLSDSLNGPHDFSEMREDRVIIYTELGRIPSTFTYRAQLSVSGEFTVPPITASDMYNSEISAVGKSETFTVSNATD